MVRQVVLALTLLCFTATAWAHGSGQHVLGTVTAIDATHIEVKTPKGATVSVKITKSTRFKEKGSPSSHNLPAIGDRVVIEAGKDAKALTATEVNFSSVKKAVPAEPVAPPAPAAP